MSLATPMPPSSEGGWAAALELAYGRRGDATVPTLRRHVGPLRVQKHHASELGVCEHILVHPPAGMAGGDSVALDVTVGPGAHALLTNPGATVWYRSPRRGVGARQTLRARIEAGATLELLPREHLVFDEAEVTLDAELTLAPDARLVMWEVMALGRPHGDAPFVRGHVRADLRLVRDGVLVYEDRLRLSADDLRRGSPLGLGGADVIATMIVARPQGDGRALDLGACRAIATPGRAGVTDLGGLVVGRWLGARVEPARAWLEAMWHQLRPAALDRPARAPRIWRT